MLVVLDGVRWQEVFDGADAVLASAAGTEALDAAALMPHLHEVIAARGAALGAPGRGAAISASGPNFVSLPGYSEIFTGRRDHACDDNDCPPTASPTLFDEARAAATSPGDVAVFASWERIARAAARVPGDIVVSTGRSRVYGDALLRGDAVASAWLAAGASADPFPGHGDFRPDRFTAGLALRYLETRRPRLAFIGLGEPDEYAHRGDYAGYLRSLSSADAAIGQLFATLDRMGARGAHTTVFITSDHGRAHDYRFHGREFPESARVWLVAAGPDVHARGFVRAEAPHRLADIAPTLRRLLHLTADTAASAGSPLEELFAPPPDRTAALTPRLMSVSDSSP